MSSIPVSRHLLFWSLAALGLAADLHLASAFPGTDLVEYLVGSPYIDGITDGGWTLDADGMLAIPDAPGLGITVDLDGVARYADRPEALAALRQVR